MMKRFVAVLVVALCFFGINFSAFAGDEIPFSSVAHRGLKSLRSAVLIPTGNCSVGYEVELPDRVAENAPVRVVEESGGSSRIFYHKVIVPVLTDWSDPRDTLLLRSDGLWPFHLTWEGIYVVPSERAVYIPVARQKCRAAEAEVGGCSEVSEVGELELSSLVGKKVRLRVHVDGGVREYE